MTDLIDHDAKKEKQREYMKQWRSANAEKVKAYQKNWKAENAVSQAEYQKAYQADYYPKEDNRRKDWERNLRRNYNMSPDDFNKMWKAQDGKCAVCQVEMLPRGRKSDAACVDHNHATGEVRGLLCRACNHGIGNLKDSPEVLTAAAKYLIEKGHYSRMKRN
jgi:hypothetical protein